MVMTIINTTTSRFHKDPSSKGIAKPLIAVKNVNVKSLICSVLNNSLNKIPYTQGKLLCVMPTTVILTLGQSMLGFKH